MFFFQQKYTAPLKKVFSRRHQTSAGFLSQEKVSSESPDLAAQTPGPSASSAYFEAWLYTSAGVVDHLAFLL